MENITQEDKEQFILKRTAVAIAINNHENIAFKICMSDIKSDIIEKKPIKEIQERFLLCENRVDLAHIIFLNSFFGQKSDE